MPGINKLLLLMLVLFCALPSISLAAPRDTGKPDSGAVQKLQAMVKSLTNERDAAKAEATKTLAEVEQLKKENKEHVDAIKSTEAAKQQLDSELTAQKTSTTEVQTRLEQTNTRLLEVIDKYKALNQSKNELASELAALNNKQQTTEQKLTTCEQRNVKLYESGKELLERYESKGTLSSVLQDEPLLQFNSVEMETIKQDYEDKLRSGVYKP